MQLRFAVIADSANVSREGKVNISGIFGMVNSAKFPAGHAGAQLVLAFEAHANEAGEKHAARILFADADGTRLAEMTGEITIPEPGDPSEPIQLNLLLGMPVIPFPEPGSYAFDIFVDDRWVGSIPLTARLLQPDTSD